ncbi:MAG: aldo/keto reductase [Synergistaceae bacterium]
MQYREIKKTGEKLSLLGFGCMRFQTKLSGKQYSRLIDIEKAKKQIFHAIDLGINYLDTAYPYHFGASESFLGEHILCTPYRQKINIATKLPCYLINDKKSIEKYFLAQLKKLNVECIDYYLLHAIELRTYEKMKSFGIIEFMNKIKKEGKIRNIGFSFHGAKDEFNKIIDDYDWDFTQVQYNLLDEQFQAGIDGIKYASSKDMGVIIMEPLRGGSLVSKIPQEVKNIYVSAKEQRTPAEWALKWIADKPEITMILSGMNTMEQIDENCKILSTSYPNSMTEEENKKTTEVKKAYEKLLKVRCTECSYCMPCPAGINIPATFKNYNSYYLFSKSRAKMQHMIYSGFRTADGKAHWVNSCINCGKCEKVCPQKIEIRKELKSAGKVLENYFYKTLAGIIRTIS